MVCHFSRFGEMSFFIVYPSNIKNAIRCEFFVIAIAIGKSRRCICNVTRVVSMK